MTAEAQKVEHRIGVVADFPQGEIIRLTIEGRTLGAVRSGDRVYVFANRCPHHGAPMCAGRVTGAMVPSGPDEYQFGLDGLVIRCPWHAYEFNLENGESIGNIIQTRLRVYPTEIRDNVVFCHLSRAPVVA